ncbi:hypothetical protein BLNAU_11484 [Blattamonas nauphoetae]|uniref:Uncharacterized protein n=1 Tax=Blattamonas nauphoetae TaxID=2049346 RepID=A0ABQ9XSL0_9EUKA|nr:hypothetical protein BLNAU_11484 [Blattamonas nauphoetae]
MDDADCIFTSTDFSYFPQFQASSSTRSISEQSENVSSSHMESSLSSTIPRPTFFVTPPKLSAHLVFSPSHSLTHSLPNQPQLRLTTPPSRHPPPLTQPALRRLDRLSPVFTCGTRGGRFVGSDSESEMTLSVWIEFLSCFTERGLKQ